VLPRVLVLVLSIDKDPWRQIERHGQRATWAARSPMDQSMPILFYRGTTSGVRYWGIGAASRLAHWTARESSRSLGAAARRRLIRAASTRSLPGTATQTGDVLTVSVPETYGMIAAKLWVALHHLVAHVAFDYVLRTNTSTYIDRTRLAQFVTQLPRTGYYGGHREVRPGYAFAQGSGILMSRDVVTQALAGDWDFAKSDDVALGKVLAHQGVDLHHINRPLLREPEAVSNTDMRAFMWRCKGSGRERNDVGIMLQLHAALHLEAGPNELFNL
jgi:hypothetical protein